MSISFRLAKKLAERAIDEKHTERVYVPISMVFTLLEELDRRQARIKKLIKAQSQS